MNCFGCGAPRRLRHNYPRPVTHLNVPGLPIDLDAPATSVPSRKSLSNVSELPLEGLASVSLTGCDHAGVRTNQDAFAGDACFGGDPDRSNLLREKRTLTGMGSPALKSTDCNNGMWHGFWAVVGACIALA